jgi:hypothetical protein
MLGSPSNCTSVPFGSTNDRKVDRGGNDEVEAEDEEEDADEDDDDDDEAIVCCETEKRIEREDNEGRTTEFGIR